MSGHSKLPPSSAARRVACPGSRALEAQFRPTEASVFAREGEAAHWVASQRLKLDTLDLERLTPSGVEITAEMREGAELYFACIMKVLGDVEMLKSTSVEKVVSIATIHPQCWGTPDAWFYNRATGELHIWDYKYGHGYVEVVRNWQLIEYAAGILSELGINGIHDQHMRVTFYIVQPRHYHRDGPIRTWQVLASDLRGDFNILRGVEAEAMSPEATCTPNPECTYCLGRHACEALRKSSLAAVDVSTSNTAFELSPLSIGSELRYLKHAASLLEARITGLEGEAGALLRRGERVPFFRIEQSKGREAWKKPVEEVLLMGDMLGLALAKPAEAVTPRQAVKAGLPEELLPTYAQRTPGAMKLVMDENQDTARKIFGSKE